MPKGVIIAMLTPMKENEEINEKMLKKMINRSIEAGLHGIFY